MKLVVDIGNSRIKWACLRDGALGAGAGFGRSDIEAALDEAWSGLDAPSAILVSSVAGSETNDLMDRWMSDHWARRPQWFDACSEVPGLVNGYTDPMQLGSDRWAALAGARSRHRGALGVIDAGTAVTLDVVDGEDRHLGGLIMPGPELSITSLMGNTAKVREMPRHTDSLLGHSTGECVANGVRFGLAGAIERWMTEVEAIQGGVAWMATGGSWGGLESMISRRVEVDPDLVLRGLAHVLARG